MTSKIASRSGITDRSSVIAEKTLDTPTPANPINSDEPLVTIEHNSVSITLLGTAHVSRASAAAVTTQLASDHYDAVAIELCPSRYNAMIDPDSLARMDLFQVIRAGKAAMMAANLALGAYQQRIAEQFGIEPGAEMRAAIDAARPTGLPILLVDREIGTTLKRVYHRVRWWRRLELVAGLIASVFSRESVSEEEIEKLKQGDMLESAFTTFANEAAELYEPLIAERDQYMAARLIQECEQADYQHILVVIGAGHLKGLTEQIQALRPPVEPLVQELESLPPPSRWPKLMPWFIVALVLTGFYLGFQRGPELGWSMIKDWVLINGTLSAAGALIAGGHILTVLIAFLAAPLTSLNPMIGAGMVTALAETWLRKPSMQDFADLRKDAASLTGWWRNRVARVLLVFIFSTVGSAIGTWIAGFRIADKLL